VEIEHPVPEVEEEEEEAPDVNVRSYHQPR